MLLAYAFFSMTDTSVRWLALAGLPALQLVFMRYAVHLVLSTAPMLGRDHSGWTAPRAQATAMLLRGALLLVSTTGNFVALRYIELSMAAAIMFTSPILVSALSVPLLGERVGRWRWGAIVAGFAGVLVVVRPWSGEVHWAVLLSLLAATALALFSIMTRRMAGVMAPRTMQLYAGLVGTVATAPLALLYWQAPQTATDWILLVAIGGFAWIGHHFFAQAHAFAPASVLMPYTYSFLVYVSITGFAVFGTVPDAATLAGAGIIVAAGLVIWWRERGLG